MLNKLFFKSHLEEDEILIRVVHKHWLLGIKALFWATLCLAGCIWLLILARAPGIRIAEGAITVVILVWWLRNFFDYYLDAWLVTDHGIIDIAWFGWFHRKSTRILYSDLEGVSYEIKGVWGTVLRFGSISVEKISTGSEVTLEYVSRPKVIELEILKHMETYLHSKNMKDTKNIQDLLSAIVKERTQLQEFPSEDDSE